MTHPMIDLFESVENLLSGFPIRTQTDEVMMREARKNLTSARVAREALMTALQNIMREVSSDSRDGDELERIENWASDALALVKGA